MTWYTETDHHGVYYNKPIIASRGDKTCLLLPHIGPRREPLGYDWFDLDNGRWNSSMHWDTAEQAIEAYKNRYYICNAVVSTKEDR